MINFSQSTSTLQSLLYRQRTTVQMTNLLAEAEKEMSTGRHADMFKSLGSQAVQALSVRASYDRIEAQQDANALLESRLELMASTLGDMREQAEEVMTLALANLDYSSSPTVEFMQQSAKAAYDAIASLLNTKYNGSSLYGGIDTDKIAMNTYDGTDGDTGLSPDDVMQAIIGGGLTDATDAAAKIAEIQAAFDGSASDANWNYEASFYNGTPAEDGLGNANPRMSAQIEEGVRLDYAVQANDSGFRDLMRGLAMLASVDVGAIADPDAYNAWMKEASSALKNGVDAVLASESSTGMMQQTLDRTQERLDYKITILTDQISSLEGVDAYEAATRLTSVETQLQASYAVTARLQSLSFLNFM
ncbi:flagellin [Pseudooceanicola sp. C21-150M6]|uniref:flagellin n=1 Tax=Pseudooceanicola sp. C21-150M6 TaxID=3434355 RepID=UPI003D7F8B8A